MNYLRPVAFSAWVVAGRHAAGLFSGDGLDFDGEDCLYVRCMLENGRDTPDA